MLLAFPRPSRRPRHLLRWSVMVVWVNLTHRIAAHCTSHWLLFRRRVGGARGLFGKTHLERGGKKSIIDGGFPSLLFFPSFLSFSFLSSWSISSHNRYCYAMHNISHSWLFALYWPFRLPEIWRITMWHTVEARGGTICDMSHSLAWLAVLISNALAERRYFMGRNHR